MRHAILLAAIATLPTGGCQASVNVNAKSTLEEQEQVAEGPKTSRSKAVEEPPAPAAHTDYFGVARGLNLAPGKREAACSCVAAVIGYPGDEAFQWTSTPPKVGNDALVVGIGSDEVPCGVQGNGPSIRAIDRVGNDVVLVIEENHTSRPRALGAVIPNPGADGGIYLRAEHKSPYGRPLSAGTGPHGAWCKIGKGTGAAAVLPAEPDESGSKNESPPR